MRGRPSQRAAPALRVTSGEGAVHTHPGFQERTLGVCPQSDSQAQPQALSPGGLGVGGVVPQRGAVLLYLRTFLFKTPQRRLVSNSKVPHCHKLHLYHQGLSLGHQLTSQGSHHS